MQERTEGIGSGEAETENTLGVETAEPTTISTGDSAPEVEDVEDSKPESARDTVARILKETRSKAAHGDEDKEGQKEAPGAEVKPEEKKEVDDPYDPELSPPERLQAHEKQLFNNLPKGLKRALSRTVKQLESVSTRDRQETVAIKEAIMPVLDEWGEKGFTASSAIAQLVTAQRKLMNPETRSATFISLGEDLGFDMTPFRAPKGDATATTATGDISQHPEFQRLRQSTEALASELQGYKEQSLNSQVSSIVAEMAAIRDEKDSAGSVLRPLLQSDILWESVKPLVSEELRIAPGISYGEALKRAYPKLEQQIYGDSKPQPTRLPPAVNNQQQNRAAQAAISVRGRSAPVVSTSSLGEPPPEAMRNARATAEWVAKQMGIGS